MQWFPVGPDFVFEPADASFRRLSASNEFGASGRILGLAFEPSSDPMNPSVIHAIGGEGPWAGYSGTTTVFMKLAAQDSWSCPGDALLAASPNVDPCCIAAHPTIAGHVYVGTWWDRGVYRYDTASATWSARSAVPGKTRKLFVDPRPVANLGATVLYAATDNGLYRSVDNAGSWTLVLSGDVWSLAAHIPTSGAPRFYAGLATSGIWICDTHPTDSSAWTQLGSAQGLPSTFYTVLVDFCPANPDCAYAWFGGITASHDALYSTLTPHTGWSLANASPSIPDASAPGGQFQLQQWQTYQDFSFAVAPDSPGDRANDVLFFGSICYARSADAGATWHEFKDIFHVDLHALAFTPAAGGAPPALYIGCDGGVAAYARATTSAFVPDHHPSNDERSTEDVVEPLNATFQSRNRGLHNSCVYAVAQDPAGLTPLYIGCVDSGIAFKDGGLSWRLYTGGDAFKVAVARVSGAVLVRREVFGGIAIGGQLRLSTHSEGPGVAGAAFPVGDPGGLVISTSNYVLDESASCLAGGFVGSAVTSTTTSLTAAMGSTVTVHVGSTVGIENGSSISFGNHPEQEYGVSNVTPTSFDIHVLYWDVPSGTPVRLLQLCAFRNAPDRSTQRISQIFSPNNIHSSVTAMARGGAPGSTRLACATRDTQTSAVELWTIDEAATLGATPPSWPSLAVPAGAPPIVWLAIDLSGDLYVLFLQAFADPSTPGVVTPLFRVAAGSSILQGESCTSLPAGTLASGAPLPFGKLVADPTTAGLFYAIHGTQVYRAQLDTSSEMRVWHWTLLGPGLPGVWLTDLSITNIAPSGAPPRVILRAASDGRGAWEIDVSSGAKVLATDLYVRRHMLDEGWTADLRDHLPHPYAPGQGVYHWESVDIKIDRMAGVSPTQRYFQTDPDASGTIYTDLAAPAGPITTIAFSHTQFDEIVDFGQHVPSGDRVRVHVQVHNRSLTPLDGVWVWTLWTRPAGQLPALNLKDDLTTFDFWGQFHGDGTIHDMLPPNSQWKSVGDPVQLDGLDAFHPRIASWNWNAPSLGVGDPGHYCLTAFIHSLQSPIGVTSNFSVDALVLHNKQVGQKNLQVIVVPMSGAGSGMLVPQTGGAHLAELTLDFHNPGPRPEEYTLVFDCTRLVKGVKLEVQLHRAAFADLAMSRTVHVGEPGRVIELPRLRLAPHQSVSARLLVHVDRIAAHLRHARLSVRQMAGKRVVGGSTVELRFIVPADAKQRPPDRRVDDDEREAEAANPTRSRPVWIEYLRLPHRRKSG